MESSQGWGRTGGRVRRTGRPRASASLLLFLFVFGMFRVAFAYSDQREHVFCAMIRP